MQESVTAAWGYLKTSLPRDPVLSRLWLASPGRAYLLENYQPPDPADEPGSALPPADRRGVETAWGPGDTRAPMGQVIELGGREPGFRPDGPWSESGRGLTAGEEDGQRLECEPAQPSDHEMLSALEVRMHFPEGGVPKEGPSAGIAVATALLSALLQEPVLPKVALSGEITLTGQVLPVGGLKEKLLAALREGVETVVLPSSVAPQVLELPAELKKGLTVVYVDNFVDVLPHALIATRQQEGVDQT
jgi:hypothetical protein